MKIFPRWFRIYLGDICLFLFVSLIVIINWKSGYFILGNDTYAPEINPRVSLERYISNPAWRSYRALGVPSDSEQADVIRVGVYRLLEGVVPRWALAQLYLFFSLYIAAFGVAQLTKYCVSKVHKKDDEQLSGFVSGVIYTTSLISAWMFASPLYAFLAAFTFLPILLWAIALVFEKPGVWAYILLYIAVLIHTISGMVPTTFIIDMIIVFAFLIFLTEERIFHIGWRKSTAPIIMSLVILIGTQLFWILPFTQYVKTNAQVLTQSKINRGLTPNLIENEVKYSTFWQVPRFFFAWMNSTNDDGTKQNPFASFYTSSVEVQWLGLLPLILAAVGVVETVHKGNRRIGFWILSGIVGWVLLTGVNLPFGELFTWFQQHIPLFTQVFRWQSSKVFPMMVIPIAILGGYAVVYISHIFRKRAIGFVLALTIVVAFGLYQQHYFNGTLINGSNQVKIPEEYFALAGYLQKHDSKSRIYMAPEANTLYFRSYSWGFFGSSFLNYLIPNPVIEKAMTTGSLESEDAQFILEKAYNAKNPRMFASALRRYRTPYVLFDGYAARLHNGYFYDESAAVQALQNNQELRKIWEKGKLQLYALNESIPQKDMFIPVYDGHDVRRLNTLLALSGNEVPYVSQKEKVGIIYPFSLVFDSLESSDQSLVGTVQYTGKASVFVLDQRITDSNYIVVSYDKKMHTLNIKPSYPQIFINDKEAISLSDSSKKYSLNPSTDRLSIDGYTVLLVDLATAKTFHVSNDPSLIVEWGFGNKKIDFVSSSDAAQEMRAPVLVDNQIQFTTLLESSVPVEVNICIFSSLKDRCMNQNHSVTVNGQTRVSVSSNESVETGDTVTAYIRSALEGERVTIHKKEIIRIPKVASQKILAYSATVPTQKIALAKGDHIRLVIPKIYSNQSYQFTSDQTIIPPVHHDTCKALSDSRIIRMQNVGPLQFISGECADKVTTSIPLVKPRKNDIAMIFWRGSNTGGIPLIVSLTPQKSGYAQYEDMLPYGKRGSEFGLVPLIDDAITYDLSLYSYGIGSRKSINELDSLSFQLIPESWYSMRLVPEGIQSLIGIQSSGYVKEQVQLIGINEAMHPNWRLVDGKNTVVKGNLPVVLNGWEQGWEFNGVLGGGYHGFFWPNILVYVGYGLTGLIGICLLLWRVLLVVKKRRI